MAKPRFAHVFERDDDDWYVEEKWCSDRLFEEERFGGTILDPCCGAGRILYAARTNGLRAIGSDIVDRRAHAAQLGLHDLWKTMPRDNFRLFDFLAPQPEETLEWCRQATSIVTNPPFSKIKKMAKMALAMNGIAKIALLVPLRRLPAATWLEAMPLARVWLLTPRPSMPTGEHILAGGRVGGGTQDFCWLVFRRGCDQKLPLINWLHRDPK